MSFHLRNSRDRDAHETPIADLSVNGGKPLSRSGPWEKTIFREKCSTFVPKFRHHGPQLLLSGSMPRGGTLAVDDSHNGRRVSSKDIVACGKWMLSPGYRPKPGALRVRRSMGSPGAIARVGGSAGTKLALVVVPSETVSMGVLDEHARPEHDEIEGFFGHHTALYRKKAVSRCEGRSVSIRIYKVGRPHPHSGTGLSGSSSWTTIIRASLKNCCFFAVWNWGEVALPYGRAVQ